MSQTDASTVAVVVLGWRANPDGSATDVLRWRVVQGVDEWRRHSNALLVVSGGAVSNEVAEGPVMAAVARDLGVPNTQILIDDQAVDTWQNVSRAHDLIPQTAAVVLISDPLHARRARRYWHAQFPNDHDRVRVGRVASRSVRWYWPVFSLAYETTVWLADLVRRR